MSICSRCQAPTEGRAFTICLDCVRKSLIEFEAANKAWRKQKVESLKHPWVFGVDITISGDIESIDEENWCAYVKTEYGTLKVDLYKVEPVILAPG